MRWGFFFAALASSLFYVVFWYQETAHLCPVPIAYTIGEVDERFDISPEELKVVAAAAESIWEEAMGEDLFVYDTQSDFPINLIYDDRQQLASTEEEWRLRLDTVEEANEAQLARVSQLNEAYKSDQAIYDNERSRYESKLATYNSEVANYNETGGAPQSTYARLQTEAKALARELEEIVSLSDKLKVRAEELNRLSERVNSDITTYNNEVAEYNQMFGSLEAFTQGDFKRDRINVYKFSDKGELTAVLAHEFGHALGLGHVDEESAIMYHLMTERDTSRLAAADEEAFINLCGSEYTLAKESRQLIRSIISQFNL